MLTRGWAHNNIKGSNVSLIKSKLAKFLFISLSAFINKLTLCVILVT